MFSLDRELAERFSAQREELVTSVREAFCMWDLAHQEAHDVALEDDTGYDGCAYRRVLKNLEDLFQARLR